MRIGTGYDVHRLTAGRDLVIGGVRIPYEKGLLGHSDADVLLHAIMDAHIDTMRENIAKALEIEISQVNIKATTEEGLGFTGRGEGISAQAVCLLTSPVNYYTEDVTDQGKCAGCGGCPKK